jgi:hypothetical protein
MKWVAALVCAPLLAAPPKVTFIKSFPGSTPAYFQVEVARDGSAVYKEAVDDPHAIAFRLPDAPTAEIFGLIEKIDYGQKPLEANLKVANMGKKTFRFEDGKRKHEVSFNYSLDESAQRLTDFFERINETQQHFINLERSVRFDRLGVNKIILQIEASNDRQRILGEDALLPLLDRVAKSEAFMHMTRERAARLAEALRSPKKLTAGGETAPDAAAPGAAAQQK